MKEEQLRLSIGSLLHDIGKIVYSGDGKQRNPSRAGAELLKRLQPSLDSGILDCVSLHDRERLRDSELGQDNPAYLCCLAKQVAAAVDRKEGGEREEEFDQSLPLRSIFNRLNGKNGNAHYERVLLNPKAGVPYPTEEAFRSDAGFFQEAERRLEEVLKDFALSEEYLYSLLSVLEEILSYLPLDTKKREDADISLYDHVKMTAAVAECLFQALESRGIRDYRSYVLEQEERAWEDRNFLLFSMDVSGIQDFIYTISSKGALKGLRARSFYLELLMEHVIDEMLQRLSLSRSVLIYAGGGHSYLLLPNTEQCRKELSELQKELNHWFMEQFGVALYMACGYAECSAKQLRNEPDGAYRGLFLQLSREISEQKSHRYTASDILSLNRQKRRGERECEICRRMEKLDDHGHCPLCRALLGMSNKILEEEYFLIFREDISYPDALPLPYGKALVAGSREFLEREKCRDGYIRSYRKNQIQAGKDVTAKLWVGDYHSKDTFGDLAKEAEGIERIAVFRGDVDNLGHSFVNGFHSEELGSRYETLSRTAALSRQLSLFFKCEINRILEEGSSDSLKCRKRKKREERRRDVSIVYSGGDDIFLVGAWNDVLEASIDIRTAFLRFTEGSLSLSGGIGIYRPGYPINRIALETAELEDYAKRAADPGSAGKGAGKREKNALTLFEEGGRYFWEDFTGSVLGEKYRKIEEYFSLTKNHGKAFLYHILELLRSEDRINRARFVYFLSRMEPEEGEGAEEAEAYRSFSGEMYRWIGEREDRRQLITAIYLYIYRSREREERKDDGRTEV